MTTAQKITFFFFTCFKHLTKAVTALANNTHFYTMLAVMCPLEGSYDIKNTIFVKPSNTGRHFLPYSFLNYLHRFNLFCFSVRTMHNSRLHVLVPSLSNYQSDMSVVLSSPVSRMDFDTGGFFVHGQSKRRCHRLVHVYPIQQLWQHGSIGANQCNSTG